MSSVVNQDKKIVIAELQLLVKISSIFLKGKYSQHADPISAFQLRSSGGDKFSVFLLPVF